MRTRAELQGLLDRDKRFRRGLGKERKQNVTIWKPEVNVLQPLFNRNDGDNTLKTSAGGGLLDTSIGVSSCRFKDWPEQSLRSEGIDFS